MILLLFCILSVASFGQGIPFHKVKITDSIALAHQMQQLAAACGTQNTSALDLFKFQLIQADYKAALVTINKKIRETPREERVYLDLSLIHI